MGQLLKPAAPAPIQPIRGPAREGTPCLFRHGGARTARLDFSASVNPLGPSAGVLDRLRRSLDAVARYPDPECRELTRRLAELHAIAAAEVVVGNGSNDLIHAVARALRPRRVAIVEPAYTEYLRASWLAGAEATNCASRDLSPGPFDPAGADLVWLANPGNPTGLPWPAGMLADWAADFPRTVFVVDEAFLPFLADEAARSLAAARPPNVVVLRSLTKVYALPGLRLGYAVARHELAARIREQTAHWSVNVLAQEAGLAAVDDASFLDRTRAWLPGEREALAGELRRLGPAVEPLPSRANFLLLRLREPDGPRLTADLAAQGVAVRDASNFVGLDGRYVRIAVRTAEDNRRLCAALRSALGG